MKTTSLISRQLLVLLVVGSLLSSVLVFIRVIWSGSPFFIFMIWNLFLAWLPLLLVYGWMRTRDTYSFLPGILLILWLLFFPNAPYIITDLFHLYYRDPIPLWYDLVLLMNFVWLGLILGYLSLYEVQKWFTVKTSIVKSWVLIATILILSGFGMYIGRYLRFNSWSLIVNPFETSLDIIKTLVSNGRAWGASSMFSIFLIMSYTTFYHLINVKGKNK